METSALQRLADGVLVGQVGEGDMVLAGIERVILGGGGQGNLVFFAYFQLQ